MKWTLKINLIISIQGLDSCTITPTCGVCCCREVLEWINAEVGVAGVALVAGAKAEAGAVDLNSKKFHALS